MMAPEKAEGASTEQQSKDETEQVYEFKIEGKEREARRPPFHS